MIPLWKNIPIIRLLLPLMIGIVCGWYLSLHWLTGFVILVCGTTVAAFFLVKKIKQSFKFRWLPGAGITLIFLGIGILLTWLQQVPHQPNWFGHFYEPSDIIQVRLLEPPSEKQKTYKALAEILSIHHQQTTTQRSGRIMLYFQKDSLPPNLGYGSILYTSKYVQEIKNAGNPGGFDYKQFALFKGITHQLFLKNNEYVLSKEKKTTRLQLYLFTVRSYILNTIRKHVNGAMQISVAEALLVGYRDDLDRDLVQAFSNTGVVHIIAISGMHLGLIYLLLVFLFKPLDKLKRFHWLKALLILCLLWLFSLLTGGGASVLRAVIMFSFITAGGLFDRKGSIYNSLAASAFLLLCYNPFLLWDVGFQLSYAAVLSIVLFMKPIYNLLVIDNKLLDKIWQLNAVTLAAQILTLPLCMYHFHQSPNLFLLANIIAVPLGTLALYSTLLLVACSFSIPAATLVGKLVTVLLSWLNGYILWLDRFTFSVTDGIYHTPVQTLLLYSFIAGIAVWLLQKRKPFFFMSLGSMLLFLVLHAWYQYETAAQKKLIVYNLAQHEAIDLFAGKKHWFKGDSVLLEDGFLRNFHLKPSRIRYRTYQAVPQLIDPKQQVLQVNGKRIFFLNQSMRFDSLAVPLKADVIIVSKNPRLYIKQLKHAIQSPILVFDSSNPKWKVDQWKQDCSNLGLRYFSTAEQGAFVMNL